LFLPGLEHAPPPWHEADVTHVPSVCSLIHLLELPFALSTSGYLAKRHHYFGDDEATAV
jgi:hypothetical protein